MSIAVLSVEPQRVLLAVDTACEILGEAAHVEAPKLHLVPHAGIALVGLGTTGISEAAYSRLCRPGHGVGFDLAVDHLREWLDAILAGEHEQSPPARAALLDEGNAVYLAGFSHAAGRMRAACFLQGPRARTFTQHEIPRWTAHPRDPDADLRAPESLADVEAMARGAVAYGKRTAPGLPYGGRLVLAEITRDEIRTRIQSLETP